MKRRVLSSILTLALCLNLCPVWVLAAEETGGGLCPHHLVHTDDCGYAVPVLEQECTHDHDDSCYTAETACIHEHTAECYPDSDDALEAAEPDLCAHVCTEDGGCVTQALYCPHEHDDICGYVPGNPGAPCGFACRICPVEDLIGKLPRSVSERDIQQIQAELSEIYDLYEGLTAEEQRQVDLSPCVSLLEQIDELGSAILGDDEITEQIFRLTADRTYASPYEVSRPFIIDTSGYTLTGTGSSAVLVTSSGDLELRGTVIAEKGAGVEVSGSLRIIESGTSIEGEEYALKLNSGAKVQLSTGTYYGFNAAIQTADGDFAALLAPGCAYFDGDGNPMPLADVADARTVVVAQCTDHPGKTYTTNAGTPTHAWTCPDCGTKEDAEPCQFTFDPTGVGTCDLCGNKVTIEIDRDSLKDLAYDNTVQPANGTVTVTVDGASSPLTPDSDYSVSYSTRADVGNTSYTVTVTVTGKAYTGTFEKEYTFTKDELTQPVLEWSANSAAVPYTGSPVTKDQLPSVTINVTTSSGIDLHDQLRYSYREQGSSDAYTDGLPTNAGTYDVVVSLAEGPDYQAASSDPITLTVNKISPIATPPAAAKPIYNGTAQALVTAGTLCDAAVRDGLEIKFATNENGPFSATIPAGMDAGADYRVWYTVEVTDNYLAIDPDPTEIAGVEIQRKIITPKVELSEYKYLYDGGWKEPKVTVKDGNTVLPDNEYQVAYENNRDVSTADKPAKVVVTDKEGGNYAIKRVEAEFQITSREQAALSITNYPNTVTYGDKFTLGTSGGSGNGTVTWKVIDGTAVVTVNDGGQVVITGDGEATIQATKSGKDPATGVTNYEDAIATWTLDASKKSVTATVTAEDKDYDSSAIAKVHAVVEQGVLPGDVIKIDGLIGTFDNADAGADKTVTVDITGEAISGNNSQHYIVSYSSLTVKATIYKAIAEITTPPVAASLTYDGTEQTLIDTGAVVNKAGIDVEYALSEDGPYFTAFPKGTNAGTYTVWYRVQETDNYTGLDPEKIDVPIAKKPVTPVITLDQDTFVYDGTPKEPVVTLTEAGGTLIPADEYTVDYSDNVNFGTATVTVTAKPGGNYSFTPVEETFTIGQKQATVLTHPKPAGKPLVFDNMDLELVTEGTGSGGTMVYSLSKDDPTDPYLEEIPTGFNAGVYTVYYKVKGDDNHSDSGVGEVEVTISPKTVKDPTIELFDGNTPLVNYIYDGNKKEPEVVVKDGSTVIDKGEYNTVYSNNRNAGTATVSITDKPGGNYTVTGSAAFVILKADIVFNPDPQAADITYDGKAHELLIPGTTNGGEVLYALGSQTGTYLAAIPTASEAEEYTVYYKVVGDENHNSFDVTSVTVTIKKATAQIIDAPAKIDPLVYSGQPLELITAGKTNVGSIVYSLDGTNFSPTIPTGTNAGTYKVYYKVDETGNYTGVAANTTPISVTIAPKSITPKVTLSESSYVYDGSRKSPKITLKDGDTVIEESQYTVTWADDKDPTATDVLTAVGTYTATIENVTDGNYTFNVSAKVEIVAAQQGALEITGTPEHVYYGDTVTTLGTSGGTGNGTVTWSITAGQASAEIVPGTNFLTIKGTGSVTVTAERTVPNYGTVSKDWTFTVEPKPVVAEVTIAPKAYDGTTNVDAAAITTAVNASDLVAPGDAFTINGLTGTYDNANAGTGKTVTLDDTSAVKTDGNGKYAVSYPATAKGDITPKPVTVTVTLSGNGLQTDDTVTPPVCFYNYDGKEKTPNVTVEADDNNAVLTDGDYTVSYSNNQNVGDATVTVTAKAGGNYAFHAETITFAIRSAGAVLTKVPSAKDLTYTGQAQDLVDVGTATGGTVMYSSTGAADSYTEAIPQETDAGTYTVYYMVKGDANHEDTAPAQVSAIIKPKQITPAITLNPTSFVYDGTAHKPTVTVKDGGTEIHGPGTDRPEYSVDYQDNVNAGLAKVIISDANGGNYIVNGTATFEITKNAPAVTDPVGKTGLQYNGERQDLVKAGVCGEGTVVYSVNGGNYTSAVPSESAVGTYTIHWKVLGDANHSDTTPDELTVSIGRNEVKIPGISLSSEELKYTGSQQKPVITVYDDSGRLIPEHEYTVTITGTNGNAGMVDVDTYTVTITTPSTSNYDIQSNNVRTFKIVPADQESISITGSQAQVRYGDTIQLVATGGTGAGNVTWKVEAKDGSAIASTISATGLLTVRDVGGPLVVTVTRSRGGNYADVSAKWEFSAAQKPVTAVLTAADRSYIAGDKTATVTAAVPESELVSGDSVIIGSLTGMFDTESVGTAKKVTVDRSNLNITGINSDKYTVTIPETTTASILAAAATVDTDPTPYTLTYDASREQKLVTAGAVTGGTMVYSLDDANYTPAIPEAKDAGTYTVYFKAKGDGNHTDSEVNSVQVTISKQTVTPQIEVTPPSAQYDGNVKRPEVIVRDGANNVIPESEYTVVYDTVTNWKDVGNHTVTVKNIDGGNYDITETNATFRITITEQNPLEIVGKPGLVYYGDTFTLSAVGGSGNSAVTWSSSDDTIAHVDDNGLVTIKGAGSATITATKPGGGNYNETKATYPLNALPKPVTAIVTAKDRVYQSGDRSAELIISWKPGDLVDKDTIDTSNVTGAFEDDSVGTGKTVTIIGDPVNDDTAQKYKITIPRTTTASILKADAVAPAITANTLTYTGAAQTLVSGGTQGTTLYSDTRDGVYSEAVPTGTDAGAYTVWYKEKGNDNYNDSQPQAIQVTISQKTLMADATNTTLSGSDLQTDVTNKTYYYKYDGSDKTPSVIILDGSETIPASEYTVSYSGNRNVGEATVTITNSVGGNYIVNGSVTFEIREGGAQLTKSPEAVRGLTYTGQPQQLVTVGVVTGGHIEYAVGDTVSDSDYEPDIPTETNAGSYVVHYRVVGDDNHADGEEGSVTATISPKTVVSPVITVSGAYTYDGTPKTPTVTVEDNGTEIPGPGAGKPEYTLSYRDNINAGTATVVVTNANGGNYIVNGEAAFEIAKAAATADTAPTGNTGLRYNGSAQELLATQGTATGGTMVYSLSQTGEYSAAIPTGKEVGEYEIWYKVLGDANHSDSTATALSPKVKIDRNTVTNPTIQVTPATVKYTGEKQTPTVTVKDDDGLLIDGSEYTPTYLDENGNSDLTAVGTYTVTITGVTGGNYTFNTMKTATFTITSADQTALTITGTREKVCYGDTIPLGTTGGNGAVTWDVGGSTIASIDANGLLKITGVGSVTVTATSKKTGYTDQIATCNLYAEKKPVTALVTAASKTYDGGTAATVTATLQNSDLVGSDSVKITLAGSFEDPNAGTDKKVNIDSTNPDYTGSTGDYQNYAITYPATATASIRKADVDAAKVTAPTAVENLTYTGLAQALVSEGSSPDGTMEYSLDGKTYSASLPTGTNAGDYDVWYRVKGDGNHNDTAGTNLGTVTIDPQNVAVPIIEFNPSGASYDGKEHKPAVTVKDSNNRVIPETEYTINYGAGDWTKAGDYQVTVTSTGSGNYTFNDTHKTFTILVAGQSPLSITNKPGKVQYGDSFTLSAVGGSITGAVAWESSDPLTASIDSNGLVRVHKSGSVTITAKKVADGNFGEVSDSWSFSAEKRPVTAIVTARNKPYDGGATAKLDISWKDGDLINGDTITLNLTGAFDDANVGTDKIVRITRNGDLPDGGGKYAVTYNNTTTASITAKAATVSGVQSGPWIYSGSEQPLLSGGSATNGTIVYSLNGTDFMDNVPTETNAGKYQVWYKARGNTNYADSEVHMVYVTIQPKTVTLPTIELSGGPFEYDGTEKRPTATVKDGNVVIPNSEYTVSYSNNVQAGPNATVTITDNPGGNYTVNGSATFTITAGSVSLTTPPQAKDLTYNGFEQMLVTPGTAVNGSVVYSKTREGSYTTSIPTEINADFYQVWYKAQGDGGETAPEFIIVEIKPEQVTPGLTLSSSSLTYTGSALTPKVTVSVNNQELDSGMYQISYSNNTEPGIATVTVTSTGGNYQFSAQTTFTITKAKAAFAVEPKTKENLSYTGEDQELFEAGLSLNGIVLYSQDTVTYLPAIPKGNQVGSYTFFAKVRGNSMYEDSDPIIIRAAIAKNEVDNPNVELSAISLPYTGSPQKPTVTVSDDDGNVIASSEYRVTYTGDTVNPGTYTLTITSRDKNYSFEPIDRTITILAAGQTPLTITGKQDTVYYGDILRLGATGGSGDGAVTWEATGPVDKLGDSQYKITKSGSVTITAKKAASGSYAASTDTWTFYANPKPITAIVTAASKPFDGGNSATLTVTINSSDLVGTDTFTVTAIGHFTDESIGDNKTVIIDRLIIPDGVSEKYDISWPVTTTASITPKPASATKVPELVQPLSLTYNGTPQSLLADGGEAEGGTIFYSLDNGSSYSRNTMATDAGDYNVWYKVVASDENHKDSAPENLGTVTIMANTGKPTVLCTPNSVPYDGKEKTPNVEVWVDDRIIPKDDYTVVFETGRIAVNTYKVTVTDKPGGNYEFTGSVEGSFQIVPDGQNPPSIITDKAVVYYGDIFRLSAMGGSGNGPIQWTIKEGAAVAEVDKDTGVVTVNGVGKFVVEAYYGAVDGYSESGRSSVTLVADPKVVTPVVVIAPKYYDGNTNVAADAIKATVKLRDLVADDSITINGLTATYDSVNAGTNKIVMLDYSKVFVTGKNSDRYIIDWPDSVTGTIDKAKVELVTYPAAPGLKYTSSAQPLVTGGTTVNGIGTIKYSLDQNSGYTENIPTGTNAGKYTVWYKIEDSVNYTGIPAASVEVEIMKANPNITTNPTASGTAGQLSDIKLNGGATDVPGSFTWKDGSINLGAGTSQQIVVFTPEDRANYNVVEFPIDVTITSATPGGSSDTGTNTPPSSGTDSTPSADTNGQTTVQNGTASTVVSVADGSKLVEEAIANQSQNIVIKPEIIGDVTKAQVSIPASTVSRIKNETTAALTVSAPVADVTIPNAALDTLSREGGTVNVMTERIGQSVVLTLTAGGKTVESVPGGVTLSVPAADAGPGTVAVLLHEDGTRETLRKSIVEDGKVNIPLSGSATVEIVDNSKDFADVPPTNWAADAVAFASAHELFSGTSETTFSPNQPMSRGMLATVLYNLEGQPDQVLTMQDLTDGYNDVSSGAWYADGIAWAVENGIANGYGNGQFGPNDSVTREQLAVMLWKYAGSPKASGQGLAFADAGQVSSYAQEALCWAVENGILSGYANGQLAPGGTATRAQAAQMLKNFMERT